MKKIYLLFLLSIIASQSDAQEVYSKFVKVNRNVSEGIKAFNIESLKYHAKISKSSIEAAQKVMSTTDCENAMDLTKSINIYLESALQAKDFATAEAHLITTKNLVSELFYEYNLCATASIDNDPDLSELEKEQAKLLKQQAILEEKEREIKLKLQQQKREQAQQIKQNFIKINVDAITSNLKTYNASLKACNCDDVMDQNFISTEDFSNMATEKLKTYFINKNLKLTELYTSLLKNCKTE